jgi:hypothetical protein
MIHVCVRCAGSACWCRIRSYLDSAAVHGLTALDAVTTALNGNPWLPPPPIETAA